MLPTARCRAPYTWSQPEPFTLTLTRTLTLTLTLTLTRRVITDMVAEAVAINALPAETVRAFALDWAPGAAAPVLASHLGGGAPDVIVSCDCIFADLFDRHFLLLDVLAEIAAPATAILLGFERRPGDGVERFFAQAAARGFRTTLRRRCQRVLVCELRLDPSASRAESGTRYRKS